MNHSVLKINTSQTCFQRTLAILVLGDNCLVPTEREPCETRQYFWTPSLQSTAARSMGVFSQHSLIGVDGMESTPSWVKAILSCQAYNWEQWIQFCQVGLAFRAEAVRWTIAESCESAWSGCGTCRAWRGSSIGCVWEFCYPQDKIQTS